MTMRVIQLVKGGRGKSKNEKREGAGERARQRERERERGREREGRCAAMFMPCPKNPSDVCICLDEQADISSRSTALGIAREHKTSPVLHEAHDKHKQWHCEVWDECCWGVRWQEGLACKQQMCRV